MNIYDFDNTIFDGDCSLGFYLYSWKVMPLKMSWYLFKTIGWSILYLFRRINYHEIKEKIFSYVTEIKDLDKVVNNYWDKNDYRIKKFYLDQQKNNDVIISASFDFILKPIIKRLGIKNLICTKYNVKTGKIIGPNTRDFEKVKLFKKEFKNVKVENAYSDSASDIPMLDLANKAYVVKGSKIIPLEEYKFSQKKVKRYRRSL